MTIDSSLLPSLIQAVSAAIEQHADEISALDQAIGDGDHVVNLQRGINALVAESTELATLDWPEAWEKIGMILMTTIGGASGSLFGSLFLAMGKAARGQPLSLPSFASSFAQGVAAVKRRGKSDVGEKTLLDVLGPVAEVLQHLAADGASLPKVLDEVNRVAEAGVEATRDMVPTKGRASFLGERAKGCLDPGAKSSQVMIAAILEVLASTSATPA